MKTVATAAVLMMLAASAWADSGSRIDANETAATDEPIVLSDAEMDGVSAGYIIHDLDSVQSLKIASPSAGVVGGELAPWYQQAYVYYR